MRRAILTSRGRPIPRSSCLYFQFLINDTGLPMSLSALRLCFDALGIFRGYQFSDSQLPFFAYIAMLVFGATLILPTLPFVVALLAYVPLIEVTLDFSNNLGPDSRTVEAFGLAILGVYALVLVFSRWNRGSIVFIVTTTLFVAWLNLSRQGLISQKLLLDAMLMVTSDSQRSLGASGVQGIAASPPPSNSGRYWQSP